MIEAIPCPPDLSDEFPDVVKKAKDQIHRLRMTHEIRRITMAAEIIYQEVVSSRNTPYFSWRWLLKPWPLAPGACKPGGPVGSQEYPCFLAPFLLLHDKLPRAQNQAGRRLAPVEVWRVRLERAPGKRGDCRLDVLQPLQRYGGAGIHFMFVDGRYRVNFNFLEHPRVVVTLVHPAGPVQEVSSPPAGRMR